MTYLGNNLHEIKYHIPTFYGLTSTDTVYRLAFVFRNADGSKAGRETDGSDIFMPIYSTGFQATLTTPQQFDIYDLNDSLDVHALSSAHADLSLFLGSTLLFQLNDTNSIGYKIPFVDYGTGNYDLVFKASIAGNDFYDTTSFLVRAGVNIGVDTLNGEEGLTILNDSSVYFKLRAPLKEYVYLIGDFNQWDFKDTYEMNRTPDGQFYWIILDGLDPNTEYRFQYYVGEEGIRIADAYSEKILDPWNDPFIPSSVYPNLTSYPSAFTNFPVTAFTIKEEEYDWQTPNFEKPAREDLIIYELLIRDFDQDHSYQSVINRLPYLDSLGINAIELMPVMEFEGNESWGYNPMFFMAPDKYYGTKNDFKALIDSCHGRGIAIILDIALNHAFGQCPLVRMYFDPTAGSFGQPTTESPWFNPVAKHDFNVGYDFNHESDATKYFAKRVFQHWVKEYKVDGYRVDLSKGFTQNNTLGNVGAWGQIDMSRINILTQLKNDVEEVDSAAYMVLEHFANNDEEIELSNRGFMLWGNMNHDYNEATMGYPSNLNGTYHTNRGWSQPYLVSYMESHDEERLMYRNINFGNRGSVHNTTELETALKRMEQGAAFFFTIPGPKMLWQFGEYGYDFSINYCPDGTINPDCRVANKPIRWDYLDQSPRATLASQYGKIIALRNAYPSIFRTESVNMDLSQSFKTMSLEKEDSVVFIVGNFGVETSIETLVFPEDGTYYNYMNSDSLMVTSDLQAVLEPGEYRIYTNFKTFNFKEQLIDPEDSIDVFNASFSDFASIYPNPAKGELKIALNQNRNDAVLLIISTPSGQLVFEKKFDRVKKGLQIIDLSEEMELSRLKSGLYYYSIQNVTTTHSGRFFISE